MMNTSLPRVYVFDLDGVLYRGADAVDGAAETVTRLRERTAPYPARLYFLTNNSSQRRSDYVEKLTRLGMPCTEGEVVTSASATAAYIAQNFGTVGKVALAVGGVGIRDELSRVGIRVVRTDEDEADTADFDYVVVGLARDFNYQTLLRGQQAIFRGARFIATNRDGQFPVEGGKTTPGAGAVVAALEACTDVVPLVIGKPETHGLQTILTDAGVSASEAVMIGDRLDTDVLCGNRLGMPSVLVLTGLTTMEQAREQITRFPERTPGTILTTLRELA
ncbi:MAG: HAD-IIA family hydrolase [Akkermansiaceae bacterium]|nr:HAD-IIA family hydrolase [Armatimonadota bacterium]